MDRKGSAAILAVKRSTGATAEVNPWHAGKKSCKRGIHPGYKTQGRSQQKSKTGATVAPQKGLMSSKKFTKKERRSFSISLIDWSETHDIDNDKSQGTDGQSGAGQCLAGEWVGWDGVVLIGGRGGIYDRQRVPCFFLFFYFVCCFFFNFCRTRVLFVGPLIPLFRTSSDVCPGFESQGGSLACVLPRLRTMDSSDSPLGSLFSEPAPTP